MHKGRIKRFMAGAMSAIMVVSGLGTTPLAYGGEFAEETVAVEASEDTPEVAAAEEDVAPAQAEDSDFARAGEAAAELLAEDEAAEADFEEVTEEAEETVAEAEETAYAGEEAVESRESDVDEYTEYYDDTFLYTDLDHTVINRVLDNKLNIETLKIPAQVITIHGACLPRESSDESTTLKKIDFSEAVNLQTIEDGAFKYNKGLQSVEGLNNCASLTSIGASVFEGCEALQNFTLPDTEGLEIGDKAFSGCKTITSVILPASLSKLGTGAFENCEKLKDVVVNTKSLDNNLKKDQVTFGGAALESITFAEDVEVVPDYLFCGATFAFDKEKPEDHTGTVVFNKGIKTVGEGAFKNASNLQVVDGSKATDLTTVEDYAFMNNSTEYEDKETKLKKTKAGIRIMTLCNKFANAGVSSFANCNEIQEIEWSGVRKIGKEAFMGCESLNNVVLQDGFKEEDLAEGAFSGCLNLASVTIPKGNSGFKKLANRVFQKCHVTDYSVFDEIEEFGDYSLEGNYFGTLNMADCVTKLGVGTFKEGHFTKLTIGTNSKLTTLPESVFQDCKMTTITIPANIKDVGGGNAGDSVTPGIGKSAFQDCSNASTITFSGRDNAPLTIGTSAFEVTKTATALQTVVYEDKCGVVEIGDRAFAESIALGTLDFPETLVKVGKGAFYHCSGYTGNIVIPKNIKTIGESAFEKVASAKKVIIESTDIDECGRRIFAECKITGIELPAGIKEIPDNMFCEAGYTQGTELTIPASVEVIGKNAFSGSENVNSILNKVTFEPYYTVTEDGKEVKKGNRIRKIGDYAFAYSTNLKAVVFPASHEFEPTLQIIGEGAFYGDAVLGENAEAVIDLPAGLQSIGKDAFSGCIKISHIFIPSTIEKKDIGENAFDGIPKDSFRTGEGTGAYEYLSENNLLNTAKVKDGVKSITYNFEGYDIDEIENEDNTTCYEPDHADFKFAEPIYPGYEFHGWYTNSGKSDKIESVKDQTGDLVLYAKFDVCKADENMFKWDSRNLGIIEGLAEGYEETTWIIIPNKCTSIKAEAFSGNTYLRSITFEPDSANETMIGDKAFKDCINLRTLDLTQSALLNSIGKEAFSGCTKLKKVIFNDKLDIIQDSAFKNCVNLKEITLTKGLETIGPEAFCGCSLLSKVTINASGLSAEKVMGDPRPIEGGKQMTISFAYGIFKDCAISEIVAGKVDEEGRPVKRVPSGLFYGATFAPDTTLEVDPQFVDIDTAAFAFAENLVGVDFSKVKDEVHIKDYAFTADLFLKSFVTPEKLKSIGAYAFDCDFLLEAISLPDTLYDIGKYAFEYCISLEEVTVPSKVALFAEGVFARCLKLKKVIIETDKIDTIPKFCCEEDAALVSFAYQDSIIKIDEGAFNKCSALPAFSFKTKLVDIGDKAFAECTSLAAVDLSLTGVTHIGASAFDNCSAMKDLKFSKTLEKIDGSAFNVCKALKTADFETAVSINSIGDNAFNECAQLEKVDISKSTLLKEIGGKAFASCTALKEFVIPVAVVTIGNSAFLGDDGLVDLTVNAESIENCGSEGEPAFAGCVSLETFILGSSVKDIPAYLLYKANFIKQVKVDIPAGVKTIGKRSFAGFSEEVDEKPVITYINIRNVNFAKDGVLETIGDYAFQYSMIGEETTSTDPCIVLPNSVTKLGEGTFSGMQRLRRVVLSSSLTEIPGYCFTNDDKLISVNNNGAQITAIGGSAFASCLSLDSYSIPATVVSIGVDAFKSCSSLKKLVIPNSVTSVAEGAFANNKQMTIVIDKASPVFETVNKMAKDEQITVSTEGFSIITFELNGGTWENGTVVPSSYYEEGEPVFFPIPVCEGKKHLHWYKDGDASKTPIKSTEGQKGDLKLIAEWETDYGSFTYTVYFNKNLNAAQKTPESLVVKGNEEFTLPTQSDLEVKGYTLLEWCTVQDPNKVDMTEEEKAAIKHYKPGEVLKGLFDKKDQTITLYAQWKGQTFRISYILPEKAVNHADNKDTYDVSEKAQPLADANLGIKGATFAGWTGVINDQFLSKIKEIPADTSGDLKLYAVFDYSKNNYSVTLDANEGTFASGVPTSISAHKTNGFMLPMKDAVSRPGYTFKGWGKKTKGTPLIKFEGENKEENFIYYKKNLSTKSSDDEDSSSSSDVTLYAIWNAFEYNENTDMYGFTTVSSDGFWYFPETGDPTVGGGYYNAKQYAKRKTTHSADKAVKLQKPKKQGYTFKEWSIRDAVTGIVLATDKRGIPKDIAGDILAVPTWIENQYSIIYNGNGGTVNGGKTYKDTEMRMYSVSVNLLGSKDVTSLDGRTFAGWAMDKRATTPIFEDGKTYDKLTKYDPKDKLSYKKKGKLKLFAVWK